MIPIKLNIFDIYVGFKNHLFAKCRIDDGDTHGEYFEWGDCDTLNIIINSLDGKKYNINIPKPTFEIIENKE